MKPWHWLPILMLTMSVLALCAGPWVSPCGAQFPDKFTNLTVLAKDISKQDLQSTMRAFSSALGVRCGYCHAQPEGQPEGEPDWASDRKPEKTTARAMLQMTTLINTQSLPKITTKHPDKVEVRCRTCHHGEARPFLIEDLLTTSYRAGGLDSLAAKYEKLRQDYYGSDTYNFSDGMLPNLSHQLAGKDKPEEVVRFAEYNLKWWPNSGYAHFSLGQAHTMAGDKEKAITELNKAAELDPDLKESVQRTLSRLQQ